jgi:hypothetical protein
MVAMSAKTNNRQIFFIIQNTSFSFSRVLFANPPHGPRFRLGINETIAVLRHLLRHVDQLLRK